MFDGLCSCPQELWPTFSETYGRRSLTEEAMQQLAQVQKQIELQETFRKKITQILTCVFPKYIQTLASKTEPPENVAFDLMNELLYEYVMKTFI